MPHYILDTDTITLLLNQHPDVVTRVNASLPTDVSITVISVEDSLTGWYTVLRKATRPDQMEWAYRKLAELVRRIAQVSILDFEAAAIARYQSLLRQKLNIGKYDLRIAAIALEFGAIVVTRNLRDFGRAPGLVVEDWARPSGP